jgi:hypothetical protein
MWLFALKSTGTDSPIANFAKSGDLWRTLLSLQKPGISKEKGAKSIYPHQPQLQE